MIVWHWAGGCEADGELPKKTISAEACDFTSARLRHEPLQTPVDMRALQQQLYSVWGSPTSQGGLPTWALHCCKL